MQIDSTQKKLLITTVLTIGAFVSLGWYPAHRDSETLRKQIEQTQKEIAGVQGTADNHPALYRRVEAMKAEMNATQKTIPQLSEQSGLIREITTRIRKGTIQEPEFKYHPLKVQDNYSTKSVEIDCFGDSLAVFRYVNQLEQMPQLVQLTGLYMSIDEKNPGNIKTKMMVNTFFYTKPQGK